jgi:hypothetical protein
MNRRRRIKPDVQFVGYTLTFLGAAILIALVAYLLGQ